jgi:ParB family chromosome partitioning protein
LEELAESIRHQGLIQPLLVRPTAKRYELIAGERRWRAAQLAGLQRVPALVRSLSDEQAMEAALVENLQREELTVVETARALRRLTAEFYLSQTEIARRTGKSRSAISNLVRLLALPEPVLDLLHRGELTEGHARALLQVPDAATQQELAEWIVRDTATVREVERRVARLGRAARVEGGEAPPTLTDPNLAEIEDRLRRRFGTRAQVTRRREGGSVNLEFYDDEDLWRILELLGLG